MGANDKQGKCGMPKPVVLFGRECRIISIPEPPKTSINPITADNTINLVESKGDITVTGTLSNISIDVASVKVVVNGRQAVVTGNTWFVDLSGSELADGSTVVATVTAISDTGGANSTVTDKEYSVDVVITKPSIEIDVIAGDDVITRAEASTTVVLTGTVSGLDDDLSEVKVTVGGVEAEVDAGRWSATVNGTDLTSGTVTAVVSVKDKAGNTASSDTSRDYELILGDIVKSYNSTHSVAMDFLGASYIWGF